MAERRVRVERPPASSPHPATCRRAHRERSRVVRVRGVLQVLDGSPSSLHVAIDSVLVDSFCGDHRCDLIRLWNRLTTRV